MNEAFGVGAVMGKGFRIWTKNLIPFLLITSVVYLPVIIWGLAVTRGGDDLEAARSMLTFRTYAGSASYLLNILVSAALTYGVVMELQGKRASIGACVSTGLVRFFPALGVGLLTILAVVGGCLLLVIPGIMVACALYIAMPISVIEKPGVMGALRRSRELTTGYKAQIFGLMFLLGLMAFGATLIMGVAFLPSATASGQETFASVRKLIYCDLVVQVIFGSLGSVMSAVAYYFLRNEKEGTTASELASVFE